MSRLRRMRREANSLPLAAEVCESRVLLSGAAAVHGAVQYAQAALHIPAAAGAAPAAGKTMSTTYDVTVQLPDFVQIGNPPPIQSPGKVMITTPVSTTVGSQVKIVVISAVTVGGLPALVNVSLKGKVLSSSSNGSTTTVHLAPTGTLKFTINVSGHPHTSSIRAIAPMTITLDDTGTFTLVESDFKIPPSHGKPNPPLTFLAYTA